MAGELLKPIGDLLYGLVPGTGWAVVHIVTALVGFYFASKVKHHAKRMWAFVLYGVGALLYATMHLGLGVIDNGNAHLVETILVFVAILLFGSAMKK